VCVQPLAPAPSPPPPLLLQARRHDSPQLLRLGLGQDLPERFQHAAQVGRCRPLLPPAAAANPHPPAPVHPLAFAFPRQPSYHPPYPLPAPLHPQALLATPPSDPDAERRVDLTALSVFTVDDASTTEVDDGLSVEQLPGGEVGARVLGSEAHARGKRGGLGRGIWRGKLQSAGGLGEAVCACSLVPHMVADMHHQP